MILDVDTNSVFLNGINMAKYLRQCEIQYNKGWGEDAGRNTLSGDYSGTFIGVFPKIIMTFGTLKQADIELLAPIFDSATQTIKYYDPVKKATYTLSTYSNDWGITNKRIGKNESFSVSFIARKKRA